MAEASTKAPPGKKGLIISGYIGSQRTHDWQNVHCIWLETSWQLFGCSVPRLAVRLCIMMIPGGYVQVKGLTGRHELNGRYGQLLDWNPASGRWAVQLESDDGSEEERKLVKPQNLEEFCPELQTTKMSKLLPHEPDAPAAPCFPQEFCEACEMGSWPHCLDEESALQVLANGYAAAAKWRWKRILSGHDRSQASKVNFGGLQLGGVLPEYQKFHHFHCFRTNFSNSPPSKMYMSSNLAYVGIGFNDLRVLIDATIEEGASGVRFVGIDLNEFSVAKSMIIAAMLKDPGTAVNHVLQVWYSSTWSKGTLSSFKKAVLAIDASIHRPPVKQLLEFWKCAEAPDLRTCRQEWLNYFVSETRRYDASTIASFVQLRDRLAACKYFVTGEVGDESVEKMEVGSITMWALPAHFSVSLPLHNADSIFATMNLEDYLPVRPDGPDIIQSFVNDVLKKLEHIRALLVDGRLQIDIWQGEVTVGNCHLMHAISTLSPAGISWSNLLDYTDLASFIPCHGQGMFCQRRIHRALCIFHGVGKGCLWCDFGRLV